jgi:hypothetical protein
MTSSVSRAVCLVSLLLCVSLAALWARSYSVGATVMQTRAVAFNGSAGTRVLSATVGEGRIALSRDYSSLPPDPKPQGAVPDPWTTEQPILRTEGWRWLRHKPGDLAYHFRPSQNSWWWRIGFGSVSGRSMDLDPESVLWHSIAFPLWLPTVAFAILPCLWLRRSFRRRRPGHCPSCGYDLRASAGRCPECGTAAIPSGSSPPV